jgi:hypothetical protein
VELALARGAFLQVAVNAVLRMDLACGWNPSGHAYQE